MRLTVVSTIAALLFSTSAFAQSQQAGNVASTNADETFKKLVARCDDVDTLVLRARVRLALGRLNDEAAIKDLTAKVNKGLALCGDGKIDEAKASLTGTLASAEAKVTEKFGQEGTSADVKAVKPVETADQVVETKGTKPWWKFW